PQLRHGRREGGAPRLLERDTLDLRSPIERGPDVRTGPIVRSRTRAPQLAERPDAASEGGGRLWCHPGAGRNTAALLNRRVGHDVQVAVRSPAHQAEDRDDEEPSPHTTRWRRFFRLPLLPHVSPPALECFSDCPVEIEARPRGPPRRW